MCFTAIPRPKLEIDEFLRVESGAVRAAHGRHQQDNPDRVPEPDGLQQLSQREPVAMMSVSTSPMRLTASMAAHARSDRCVRLSGKHAPAVTMRLIIAHACKRNPRGRISANGKAEGDITRMICSQPASHGIMQCSAQALLAGVGRPPITWKTPNSSPQSTHISWHRATGRSVTRSAR